MFITFNYLLYHNKNILYLQTLDILCKMVTQVISDGTVVQWLAVMTHSNKAPGSIPTLTSGLSVWSLDVLPIPVWDSFECSSFLPQSTDMQIRSSGCSKLPMGVNVCLWITTRIAEKFGHSLILKKMKMKKDFQIT